jgi:hypothetical protein
VPKNAGDRRYYRAARLLATRLDPSTEIMIY